MRFFSSYGNCTYLIIFLLTFSFQNLFGQVQTENQLELPIQTIRGEIRDLANHAPMPGATVIIRKDSLEFGVSADENGEYVFRKIPVGRWQMEISFVGYEKIIIKEILLESGRELVRDIWLQENAESLEQVVITAGGRQVESVQKLSAQTITVEDNTDPTFNEALPGDATVECDNIPTADVLTASDTCGSA